MGFLSVCARLISSISHPFSLDQSASLRSLMLPTSGTLLAAGILCDPATLVAADSPTATVSASETDTDQTSFADHSLLIAPEYPCTWPSYPFPKFQIIHQQTIGPTSAYNIDALLIDGNTGTQLDVPPHSVARPELNREKSGPLACITRIGLNHGSLVAKPV